ncbi:polysaccharide pyruvyl transferase family protein [Vibrio pelagius]|uniref:polysaccharide pyruvyl transferase family protein n=1 Tax=Vibrio pelagius TaxID=28169 RepID=UPI0021C2F614|nr:polysaccharide pyruvyl transferase family protein [Vibrio pelagius]
MKTVGIVTFYKAHNYGAVLQAYALKRKLNLLGLDPFFIEFDNEALDENYRLFPYYKKGSKRFVIKSIKQLLDFKRVIIRKRSFDLFIRENLPHRLLKEKISCDCVVIGSDQIWNPFITGGFDPIFFGVNENLVCDKVISYAASMGRAIEHEEYFHDTEFLKLLKNLSHISVRESELGIKIKEKFNFSSNLTIDPTLLLPVQEWDEIAIQPKLSEKYVLVYEVENHPLTPMFIETIRKKYKYEVKVISAKTNYKTAKDIITTASPQEFLGLFKHASFVITSSFHGTVFSIINKIPFFTMKFGNGIDSRSNGILKELGLLDRHIDNMCDLNELIEKDVCFDTAYERLNSLRKEAEDYLVSSLNV